MKESIIKDFVDTNGIPYIKKICKASKYKHKRRYFDVLNCSTSFDQTSYEGVLSFLNKMHIDLPNTFEDIDLEYHFTDC